jgi:hypothetical protein
VSDHPIDQEDIVVSVVVVHLPTGITGHSSALKDDVEKAIEEAKDDLLANLEVAGGC